MTAATVIIPTRDRPQSLRRCLDALGRQTGAPTIEIIVADDGSLAEDVVRQTVAAASARLVRTDGRGPAAARNAGVAVARGSTVLLTDDDCVPEADWVAGLLTALTAGYDVVRGSTVPDRPGDPYQVANELIVSHLAGETRFVSTSNIACRRAILVAHPFDERFPFAAGEDREWSLRLASAGVNVGHEPRAVVRHASEMTFGTFWRRHARYGGAARTLVSTGVLSPRRRAHIGFYARLLRGAVPLGPRVAGAVVLAQVSTVVGYARGSRRYPRHDA